MDHRLRSKVLVPLIILVLYLPVDIIRDRPPSSLACGNPVVCLAYACITYIGWIYHIPALCESPSLAPSGSAMFI
jgi:hypothetical protein